jgi:hypothetical protein
MHAVMRVVVVVGALAAAIELDAVDGCTCAAEGEGPAPEIDVDACSEPVLDGGPPRRTLNCVLNFGQVPLDVITAREIVVSNPEVVPLDVKSIHVVGDPSFRLAPPVIDHVDAQSSANIVLDVTPGTQSEIGATLTIKSNAANLGRDVFVAVSLIAN